MAFCLQCGRRLDDGVATCGGCGAPVSGDDTREPMAVVEDLARDGRSLEAIKAYRAATGASLNDAKAAIEDWLQHGNWPERQEREGLSIEARDLVRQGRKIEAIKDYREQTGSSLRVAKEAVEAWMREEGLSSGKGSGCGTSVLATIVAMAGLWFVA